MGEEYGLGTGNPDGAAAAAAALFEKEEDLYTLVLFIAVAAFSAAGMFFGACEMMAASPAPEIADLSFVQGVHLPAWLPTVFLPLLVAYGGVREWMRYTQAKHDDPAMIHEAQDQTRRISRNLALVMGWAAFLFAAFIAEACGAAGTMPSTLLYLAAQGITVLTGVHASHAYHTGKMRRLQKKDGLGIYGRATATAAGTGIPIEISSVDRQPTATEELLPGGRISDKHRELVLKYLQANECINNQTCQKITNIGRDQAHRLLSGLEERDVLQGEGSTQGRIYRLKKDKNRQESLQ